MEMFLPLKLVRLRKKSNPDTVRGQSQRRNSARRSQLFGVNTREIALISVFSALWIASEITMGDIVGQTLQIHGVVQRLVGWLLMPILAELTGRFGRVSLMAAIAALATRMIRRSGGLYPWMVGLGYALGGLAFDLLFFIPLANNLEGKKRKIYLLTISLASGTAALIPYVLYRLFTFILSSEAWFYIFIAWMLGPPSFYAIDAVKSIVLNVLGTLVGMSIMPPIRAALPNFPARIRSYTE